MIPDRLLIPDAVALWFFIGGSGVFAVWSSIFGIYWWTEGRLPRHIMMAMACALLSLHQAILATRNFRYWFSITDTVILTRLALAALVLLAVLGLPGHLRYRRKVRNE